MKVDKSGLRARCELVRQKVEGGAQSPDTACAELFGLGYELEQQGLPDAADSVYQQTIELLEELKAQPGSALTDTSVSRLAFSHGKTLLTYNKARSAIAALRRALEVVEISLGGGTNGVLMERQAMLLGWLGIAQRRANLLEDSVESYERAIAIWRKLPDMIGAPVSPYSGFLGACLLGLSKSLNLLSRTDDADQARAEADELLEKEFEQLGRLH